MLDETDRKFYHTRNHLVFEIALDSILEDLHARFGQQQYDLADRKVTLIPQATERRHSASQIEGL